MCQNNFAKVRDPSKNSPKKFWGKDGVEIDNCFYYNVTQTEKIMKKCDHFFFT